MPRKCFTIYVSVYNTHPPFRGEIGGKNCVLCTGKDGTRSDAIDLRLSTMTTTSTIKCRRFKNMKVRGFYSTKFITIPTTYTREVIPMKRSFYLLPILLSTGLIYDVFVIRFQCCRIVKWEC